MSITIHDLDIGDHIAFKPKDGKWELGVVHNLSGGIDWHTLGELYSRRSITIAQENKITGGEIYTAFVFSDLTIYKTHIDCASCGQDKQRIEDNYREDPREKIDILIEEECWLCNAL